MGTAGGHDMVEEAPAQPRAPRLTAEQADAVLQALSAAALVRDADASITAANDRVVALLGLRRDRAGRWSEADVHWVGEEDGDGARRLLRDREERWVGCERRPLHDEAGTAYAFVELYSDVSDRRAADARTRFQAELLDAVGQAVIATDAAGLVVFWNRAAQDLYGWSAEEALGRPIVELTPAQTSVEQAEEIMAAMRAGMSWTGDFLVRRRDGSAFTALVTNRPLVGADGVVTGVIGVSVDVSHRVRAEQDARRLASIVESTGDAVIMTDATGTITAWNRAAQGLYGYPAREVLGQHISLIFPAESADTDAAMIARVRGGETVTDVEVDRVRRDGTVVHVALTVSPLLDEEGAFVGASSIARDLTDRRVWQQALQHAALHDDLTGLPNRTLLSDRLDQLVLSSAHVPSPVALLFIDLDAFKDVNDAEGHLLGDHVLVEVAARLRGAVRPGDTVARFGGDEFVVLLPGADEAAATAVAAQVLAVIRVPVDVDGRRLHLSASIGLAIAPPVEPVALLRAADAAVHDAKARGRNQVSHFHGDLSLQAEERLALSGDLREALSDDGLTLVYQPVVDLGTGAALGVEALLRWEHPRRGNVPPNTFVAVAEATGLARDLDEWVVRRACAEFAALRASGDVGEDLYLAVNVTAANVVDPAFPATVERALRAADLPATALVLEVTETGVINDLDMAVRMLTALRGLGIRIAIDDFGTGWSSLTYVKRLPASIIKLDRTFTERLDRDQDDLAIAAAVVDIGRATGMTVTAEGVETASQLAALQRLGCAAGQGWLWHRAVPRDQVADALARCHETGQGLAGQPVEEAEESEAALGPENGLERLWELHGEGASFATIAAALNKEGFRHPKGQRWHSRTVAGALGRPALAVSGSRSREQARG